MQLLQHLRLYIFIVICFISISGCRYDCKDVNGETKTWAFFTDNDLAQPTSKYLFVDTKGDTTVLQMVLNKESEQGKGFTSCKKSYIFKLSGLLTNAKKGFGYDITKSDSSIFTIERYLDVNTDGSEEYTGYKGFVNDQGFRGAKDSFNNQYRAYKATTSYLNDVLIIHIYPNQGIQKLEYLGNSYKRIK